jgi:hypothetical protein
MSPIFDAPEGAPTAAPEGAPTAAPWSLILRSRGSHHYSSSSILPCPLFYPLAGPFEMSRGIHQETVIAIHRLRMATLHPGPLSTLETIIVTRMTTPMTKQTMKNETSIGCAAAAMFQLVTMMDLPRHDLNNASFRLISLASKRTSNPNYRNIGFPGENMSAYSAFTCGRAPTKKIQSAKLNQQYSNSLDWDRCINML